MRAEMAKRKKIRYAIHKRRGYPDPEIGPPQPEEGYPVGRCLAIRKGLARDWAVDHIPTGMRVASARTMRDVQKLAQALDQQTGSRFCSGDVDTAQRELYKAENSALRDYVGFAYRHTYDKKKLPTFAEFKKMQAAARKKK
jgi:hypothetical protein